MTASESVCALELQYFSGRRPTWNLGLVHMYLAAESEAKVVYKGPLFVIDDYCYDCSD